MAWLSEGTRATLAALAVLILGGLFVVWFATPQGVPANPSAPQAAEATRPVAAPLVPPAPTRVAPSAIGGGPRASDGASEPARKPSNGRGPEDCMTDDGAPYVGTDC
jgi:hypothetical protein